VIPQATLKRQVRIGLHLGGALVVVLLATIPFWVTPLDLEIQRAAWQGEAGWSLGERQPWKAIYHFGTLPALLMTLAALVALVLGLRGGRLAPWSKATAYLVLCMAIGPGILVNLVLKDHWGRPRPRDVIPFGGEYPAERVWIADPSSPGKSFPCGHCTMGFFFFAPGILLRRLGRRRMALALFTLAWGLGLLLGIARILQGGHFASDVLWGAGICWMVSMGLYYAMGLDRRLTWDLPRTNEFQHGPVSVIGGAVALLLLGGILLATPYRHEERHEIRVAGGSRLELSLVLEGNRHRIRLAGNSSEPGLVAARGNGHGLPGSGVKASWSARTTPEGNPDFRFKQRLSGWFSELDQVNEILVPAHPGEVRVHIRSGAAEIDFGESVNSQRWKVEVEPGATCRWRSGSAEGEIAPGKPASFALPLKGGAVSR
jgi:membrane-associated PAP2 superfamily phosphatase